jgi:transposase-like protein
MCNQYQMKRDIAQQVLYNWRRKYIQRGAAALINSSNERARGKLTEGKAASSE